MWQAEGPDGSLSDARAASWDCEYAVVDNSGFALRPALAPGSRMDLLELSLRAETSPPQLHKAAALVRAGLGFETVRIPKRGGGHRLVHKAIPLVHRQHAALRLALNDLYATPSWVHGYVQGRGTLSNARPHLGQPVVLRVDLQTFFAHIKPDRLRRCLVDLGLDEGSTATIVDIACVSDGLAAGFATGPVLSNIAFAETDLQLGEFAQSAQLNYTRYADDLVFSGTRVSDVTLGKIREILESNRWEINHRKTRFMRAGGPQFVTGLYVGLPDRPRIPRRMKRRLRQQLHYLSLYGYSNCHERVPWTIGHRQAHGWLNYVSSVEPELGSQLSEVFQQVDFDLPRRIGFDDEWDEWLDEFGVPEDL